MVKTFKRKKSPKKIKSPRQYWKKYLSDFNSSAKLWLEGFAIPHQTSKESTPHIAIEKIKLDKNHAQALEKFSKKNHIPLTVLIQAAWAILLNRCSGSDDHIYGLGVLTTKKNGKNKSGVYAVSNEFLPVRSLIHENLSLNTYIKNLALQLQQNNKHAAAFFKLSQHDEHLKSLYHYLFLAPQGKHKQKNQAYEIDTTIFSLLFIVQREKPLQLALAYHPLKFTLNSIQNLIQHFIIITEKIITDFQADITHFSILTSIEKRNLLKTWCKPNYPAIPPLDMTYCVHDLFVSKVKQYPTHIAVSSREYNLTYQALDEYANQLAHYLAQHHILKGETIAVLMERTPALIIAMMAIFKVGAIYVPINPKYPDDRIEFVIKDSSATMILVNHTERISKELVSKTLILDDKLEILKNSDSTPYPTSVSSDDIAYMIYTSGTTGEPKGVMIKHISLVNLVNWYQFFFSVTDNDRSSQFASSAFDSFFCETIPFLCSGASVNIIDDHSKLTPSLLLNWFVDQKITVCDLPTAYAQVLLKMTWPDGIALRLMKIGGESLTQYPSQQYSFDIWNGYGPTEATVETTFYKLYDKDSPAGHHNTKHCPPPIGKPLVNAEVYVVDQHLEPVPIGCVGELLVGGIIISTGYFNRKELTREKFIRNYFSDDPHAKLYRTGDLVRWLSNGNLEYVGRVDHQIKVRGYRIELSEIESNIRKHSDIKEVIVLAKEMITGQKSLVAYLVPNLDKIRIPFHERCLIALNDVQFVDAAIEDISKEGVAISSFSIKLTPGQQVRVSFTLPGLSETQWLTGRVVWHLEQRAGIEFDKTPRQTALLEKSINHYLATHNLLETLRSVSTKRSIRHALKNKLPEYMIPSIFSVLPNFPLTFNGKIDWKALPPPQDFERLLDRPYVAPRTETENIVAEIWQNILNLKQVSVTDNFFDLGGNSLLVSQLSVSILQRFNLSIPAKLLFDLPFIPILSEYIDSKGEKYTSISNIQDEINHDTVLHDDIMPKKKFGGDITKPRGVLLTGAGGFLGIYLLREIIKQSDAKIYCLIRKSGFESSAKKLMSNVEHFQLTEEISLSNRRIVIITGDISLDQFGIPSEQYENLADKVDVIYHCGAQVNTMAAYTNLRGSNVQGTIEIIKFATHKIDKAIHYVSTLSAAYKTDINHNFVEEFPDADLGTLVGGYAISKWVSERLLTQIKNRGLPVSIYRSGYILGQSDTGITNFNDALLLLIKGCIQLGFAPNWNEKIMLLPVDFVSKALIAISLHKPDHSMVYHLEHPRGILWRDLMAWLNNYGYAIKLCSHQEWRDRLTIITPENALYPFLPHFLETKEPDTPGTNIGNTKQALKEMGLHFPDISDHLLQLYFNYLCQTGFFPSPDKKSLLIS